jgi:hypothetical protein
MTKKKPTSPGCVLRITYTKKGNFGTLFSDWGGKLKPETTWQKGDKDGKKKLTTSGCSILVSNAPKFGTMVNSLVRFLARHEVTLRMLAYKQGIEMEVDFGVWYDKNKPYQSYLVPFHLMQSLGRNDIDLMISEYPRRS